MKKSDVPQDHSQMEKAKMTEVLYVTDENNQYTTERSRGWEAKTLALDESIELINERIREAKENIKNGTGSPIHYYMEVNRMDWSVLSAYAGKWAWFVKNDAKPRNFKKLNDKTLQKYADAFGISLDDLKYFDANK